MANNKRKQISKNKNLDSVVVLKLIVILAILLIPVAVILLSVNKHSNVLQKDNGSAQKTAPISQANLNQSSDDQYNFDAPLPSERVGDISKVPQAKIDTLFNNLKN